MVQRFYLEHLSILIVYWHLLLCSIWLNTLQAFVSEYAVTGNDAGQGSLLAALAEAGFLIGLEKNRFTAVSYNFLIHYLCRR